MLAVWIARPRVGEFDPAISTGLGLPVWVNHVAFDAPDLEALEAARDHWLDHGLDVMEIDHDWCRLVYTLDRRARGRVVHLGRLHREDAAAAARDLVDPSPTLKTRPSPCSTAADRVSTS